MKADTGTGQRYKGRGRFWIIRLWFHWILYLSSVTCGQRVENAENCIFLFIVLFVDSSDVKICRVKTTQKFPWQACCLYEVVSIRILQSWLILDKISWFKKRKFVENWFGKRVKRSPEWCLHLMYNVLRGGGVPYYKTKVKWKRFITWMNMLISALKIFRFLVKELKILLFF